MFTGEFFPRVPFRLQLKFTAFLNAIMVGRREFPISDANV